jgi:hypothetical protein
MSSKFGKGLVNDIKEERQKEEEQQKLREKYDIGQNYVVVETSNTGKFVINLFIRLIKATATVIILILAVIGLYALIYPEIRQPFFEVLKETYQQLLVLVK